MEAMDPDPMQEQLVPSTPKSCDASSIGTPDGGFLQEMLRRCVTSVPWSLVVLTAALTDLCFCVTALVQRRVPNTVEPAIDAEWSPLIMSVYALDVLVKIYVFTLPVYFRKLGNIVDFTITFVSIAFMLFAASAAMTNGVVAMRSPRILRIFFRIAKMGQCCRGMRFTSVAYSESISGVRHLVGMNKRRFVDVPYDFDLDLAYIQPRLIAMSVPALSFPMRMYRNPIREVVRFFETYHKHRYLIVNCCPELPYPAEYFKTGRVVKFDIQDHTPPTMAQVVEFLDVAREWMRDLDHVIAVHCKGGKGRTGSFCSAWMIYTRDAADGDAACESFAIKRTDSFLPYHKQTVDTPSQVRYLEHVHDMLSEQKAYLPSQVALPQCRRLRPLQLTFDRWFLVPVDDALLVAIHEQRAGGVGRVRHWSPTFRHDATGSASVELNVPVDVSVEGDIRISVFAQKKLQQARARSRSGSAFPGDLPDAAASLELVPREKRVIAGREPGCLFYFMFHSSFIGVDGKLEVPVHEMDKAGKGKHKSRYFPDGYATLDYMVL